VFGFNRRKEPPKSISARDSASAVQRIQADVPAMPRSTGQKVDEAIQSVVDHRLEPLATEAELESALNRIREGQEQGPVIWGLQSGLLSFLDTVFPNYRSLHLYGQVFLREPKGRGAHYDVYDEVLHPEYPWVAVFNLDGDAVVTVARLSDEWSEHYASTHPVPTDAAYVERRRLADESLRRSNAQSEKGLLLRRSGLIIPQQRAGPDWIHDVVPIKEENPGRFVKFAVAKEQQAEFFTERGYDALGTLLTEALLSAPIMGSGILENLPRHRCNVD